MVILIEIKFVMYQQVIQVTFYNYKKYSLKEIILEKKVFFY